MIMALVAEVFCGFFLTFLNDIICIKNVNVFIFLLAAVLLLANKLVRGGFYEILKLLSGSSDYSRSLHNY